MNFLFSKRINMIEAIVYNKQFNYLLRIELTDLENKNQLALVFTCDKDFNKHVKINYTKGK
jgi:hypothetical protein